MSFRNLQKRVKKTRKAYNRQLKKKKLCKSLLNQGNGKLMEALLLEGEVGSFGDRFEGVFFPLKEVLMNFFKFILSFHRRYCLPSSTI